MALNDDDKYKKPELTAGDVALGSAIPAYGGLKWAGGGSALQGAKTVGKGAWDTTRAMGRVAGGMAQQAGGVRGIAQGAKVVGGVTARALPAVSAGIANAFTPSEDYYERFGMNPYDDSRGALGHFGVRALGFASDLGNALTLGQAGKYLFQDKIRQNNEALAKEQANSAPQESSTQADKLKALSEQMQPEAPQSQPIQIGGIGNNAISQSLANTPQATPYQGGLKAENPNYHALMKQVEQSGTLADNQKPFLGIKTRAPQRDWENEAQRKDLLQQATTVIKGAHGLTANQMRLAHELSNDDIKMEQERHLQQNQLNHQLQQEQLQQQAQNQRALLGETGQTARAIMNEQGQNARFNTNFGLDVAKFNQDAQNSQYELGLKGADLHSRLQSQAIDDSVKQGHLDLYNQFINAKDDEQRDKILTQMAVLSGKGGGDKGDSYATMNLGEQYDPETQMTINRGQALYNTRTGQVVGGQSGQNNNANWNDPKNLQAFEKELTSKKVTGEQAQAIAQKYGIPPEFIAQYFGEQQ